MKLKELIREINNVDEDLIIFQENLSDPESNIILSYGVEGDNGIKNENGKMYYYLIEVFLAKDFINEWSQSDVRLQDDEVIAQSLFQYAIKDA